MDNFNWKAGGIRVPLNLGAQHVFGTDQNDLHAILPCGLERAFDLRLGRPVRSHRVQGYDAWHGMIVLAGFLYVQNFPSFVVTAFGTGTVRHLALVAVGALGERMSFQRVVSAPGAGAGFGVSAFRIRHRIPLRLANWASKNLLVFQLLAQIFECRPARLLERLGAPALLQVQVLAAMRT